MLDTEIEEERRCRFIFLPNGPAEQARPVGGIFEIAISIDVSQFRYDPASVPFSVDQLSLKHITSLGRKWLCRILLVLLQVNLNLKDQA